MTYYLTIEKKKELEIELKNLTTSGRKEIAERLDEAKALGDLKENAEYHQSRDDQGKMEARIRELEAMLKESEIIKHPKGDKVEIGSRVEMKKDGKKINYEIVGRAEVDILNNKIPLDSPLAKEMMGKKEKDIFIFETPNGKKYNYEILKIS